MAGRDHFSHQFTQAVQALMPRPNAAVSGGTELLAKEIAPVAKSAVLLQAEVMRLVSRRAQAYMAWPMAIATCRSPQDFFSKQQDFLQHCMDDYAATYKAYTNFVGEAQPFTGLQETLNDNSLRTRPQSETVRDIMGIQGKRDRRVEAVGGQEERSVATAA